MSKIIKPVAGQWTINAHELRQAVAEVLHESVETVDVEPALRISARIALETGSPHVISTNDLYRSAHTALTRLNSVSYGYNYLNGDRRASASALLALQSLVDPQSKKREVHEVTSSDKEWRQFLEGFDPPLMNPFVAGIRHFFEGAAIRAGGFRDAFMLGSLVMAIPFEGVDIRFNTLIQRAIQVVYRMKGPGTIIWQNVAHQYESQGRPLPPSRKNILMLVRELEGVLEAYPTDTVLLEHMKSNPPLKADIEKLFRYISAFGEPHVAKPAAEVLAVLNTDIFEKRAKAPIGQKTPNFPSINGTHEEEVISFLRDLIPQLWEQEPTLPRLHAYIQAKREKATSRIGLRFWTIADALVNKWRPLKLLEDTHDEDTDHEILRIWHNAWNLNDLQAKDIITDLDDLLWNWKMPYGDVRNEKMWLRRLIISYIALALRDETPIAFASHTISSRLADIANTPELKAVRLALFLRTENDPDVTMEEIEGMDGNYTYGQLAAQQQEDLAAFQRNHYVFEGLEPAIQLSVALNLTSPFKDYVRGSKGLASDEEKILIDDSMSKAQHYVLGGGQGAVVTGEHDYDPAYLLSVVSLLKKLTAQYKKYQIILDLSGGNGNKTESALTENAISHRGSHIAVGYRVPTVSLRSVHLETVRHLKKEGIYEETLQQARDIIKENSNNLLTFRVETDEVQRYVLIEEQIEEGTLPSATTALAGKQGTLPQVVKKIRRLTVISSSSGDLTFMEDNGQIVPLRSFILLPGPTEEGVSPEGSEPGRKARRRVRGAKGPTTVKKTGGDPSGATSGSATGGSTSPAKEGTEEVPKASSHGSVLMMERFPFTDNGPLIQGGCELSGQNADTVHDPVAVVEGNTVLWRQPDLLENRSVLVAANDDRYPEPKDSAKALKEIDESEEPDELKESPINLEGGLLLPPLVNRLAPSLTPRSMGQVLPFRGLLVP